MNLNKIIKPARLSEWVVIPTAIFKQKDISPGAVGLYCWLFSHDSQTEISKDAILSHFKAGRDTINDRLKELIQLGFLTRQNARKQGKFSGTNYLLSDVPRTEKPYTEKPRTENQSAAILSDNYINEICNDNIYNNNIYNNIYNNINNNNIPGNSKKVYSDTVKKSFNYFLDLFPEKYQPKSTAQKNKWMDCLDKIERIDEYDLREVYLVVKKMRQDDFWQNNFLSILKLRNTDKNGVKYIDRFMGQTKQSAQEEKGKINGFVKWYKYTTPSGEIKLGAKTRFGDLDQDILQSKIKMQDIKQIIEQL